MTNLVAQMLIEEPAPAVIWASLMLLALPALALLASPTGVRNPGPALLQALRVVVRPGEGRRRRRREVDEIVRYAGEVHVAAQRAERAAELWQEHWREADTRVGEEWQAWQEAGERLERARAGAAFRLPFSAPTPTEYAGRERWLHRAVRDAAGRGDLPASAVGDSLTGRGWDARLHPIEQERVLLEAVVAHRWSLYQEAVAAEQTAWHDVHLARHTRDDLRTESDLATERAAEAWATTPRGRLHLAARPALGLTPA
jgi:hypothetical protein